ncbi:methyltransferase domain-containing protein [Rugosimonospora africana]|uniref:Trans-aconitate 2-methyltransferase n=1 Tax=Rugosimonospora africana TaxID=556532 RepID=A0A8J3R2B1_9ACTN|nr:methyltransferase domain-containing protein [Rugosimonospora africana]GIH20348.1 trans-aconitate 2-methyltransferase [Rugosimonospora africana]
MISPTWDPTLYLRFADERARPFADLVSRIAVPAPARVVDLGCGPGNVTATLLDRWSQARVLGVDSSPEMIEEAAALARPGLEFVQGEIETWAPGEPVDVIVSNAALQWVPSHLELLPRWVAALAPGGALALQMPTNAGGGAARVFRTVATGPRFADRLTAVAESGRPSASGGIVRPAAEYVDVLARLGCRVDAWDTTYQHVLPGDDPVLAWYEGTGLRPYLEALEPERREEFRAEVAAGLRTAFPRRPYGTVLPFTRTFVIAYRI